MSINQKAIRRLQEIFTEYQEENGLNETAKIIAKGLGGRWSWEYIKIVYYGKTNPSRNLAAMIAKLHKKIFMPPKPPRQRFRVHAEFATAAERYLVRAAGYTGLVAGNILYEHAKENWERE